MGGAFFYRREKWLHEPLLNEMEAKSKTDVLVRKKRSVIQTLIPPNAKSSNTPRGCLFIPWKAIRARNITVVGIPATDKQRKHAEPIICS